MWQPYCKNKCTSGVPADGGGSNQHAKVCSVGQLQSILHAVCERWWGEVMFSFLIWSMTFILKVISRSWKSMRNEVKSVCILANIKWCMSFVIVFSNRPLYVNVNVRTKHLSTNIKCHTKNYAQRRREVKETKSCPCDTQEHTQHC